MPPSGVSGKMWDKQDIANLARLMRMLADGGLEFVKTQRSA